MTASASGDSPFGATNVPTKYQGYILAAAARWNISPAILAAQLNAESGFNERAVSSAGAQGIAQFLPATARSLGVDPWNPQSAIDGMAKYDAQNLAKFKSVDLMLAAYNAGPGAVSQHDGVPPYAETQNYVKKILAAAGSKLTADVPAALTGHDDDDFAALTGLVERVQSVDFWKRNGIGALGVAVAIVGGYFLMEKQGFSVVRKVDSVL